MQSINEDSTGHCCWYIFSIAFTDADQAGDSFIVLLDIIFSALSDMEENLQSIFFDSVQIFSLLLLRIAARYGCLGD